MEIILYQLLVTVLYVSGIQQQGPMLRHSMVTQPAVSCAVFSNDGIHFLTGSHDQTVKVWDIITGEPLHSIDSKSVVTSVAFSSKGDHVIFGCHDWYVKSWKPWEHSAISKKYPYDKLGEHTSQVTSVCFSPDDLRLKTYNNSTVECRS